MHFFLKGILFSFLLCALLSCGDDSETNDVCNASTFNERIPTLTSAYTAALQNYGQNPSDQNCNNLNTAYSNFLSFLQEVDRCPFTINGGELGEVIRDLERDKEEFQCD